MSLEMERRDFLKLTLGAIAAAYIPATAERIIAPATPLPTSRPSKVSTKVVTRPTREFIIQGAEWYREETSFSHVFRIYGHFRGDTKLVYAASHVDQRTMERAKHVPDIIKAMLENMEYQVTKFGRSSKLLTDRQGAYFVYGGALKRAMEQAGVRL